MRGWLGAEGRRGPGPRGQGLPLGITGVRMFMHRETACLALGAEVEVAREVSRVLSQVRTT